MHLHLLRRTQTNVTALDDLDLSDEDSQTESDFDGSRRRTKRVTQPPPPPVAPVPAPVDPDAEKKKIFEEVHMYLPQPGSKRAGVVPPGKTTQRATKHMYVSKEDMKDAAETLEILVPIRIEFEHEGYKIRDTITWNLNGMHVGALHVLTFGRQLIPCFTLFRAIDDATQVCGAIL